MSKITQLTIVTYTRLITFINIASAWLQANPKESKLKYALERVMKRAGKLYREFQEKIEDINVELCAVDRDGVVLRDEKGEYRFTKEGLKSRLHRIRGLEAGEVKIEPYFATEIPKDLPTPVKDALAGFVIDAAPED